MKILIATNHLANIGGTETWTYTMANAFKKLGHNVDVVAIKKGWYAVEMIKNGINIKEEPGNEYDLIIINHITCLRALQEIKGYKVFTSHGVVPELEQPDKGADSYVAISEEVRDHMKELGFKADIIRNPVDVWDEYFPKREVKEIKKCLIITDTKEGFETASEACKQAELEYFCHGKMNPRFSLADEMNEADVVISLGRGCYEAMACGRNVIIYDWRQYMGEGLGDGIVNRNIWKYMENNCSGRYTNKKMSVDDLAYELKNAWVEQGLENRTFAENVFDSLKIADKYIKL